MKSVYPTVSSVAWASYMTGRNPGRHNIYGFVDRKPGTYDIFIPNSQYLKSRTLWEHLSDAGKRVVVINVPVTYPPRRVNGVLVGCFLGSNMDKIAYPPTVSAKLKELGYRIDVDAQRGHVSKDDLLADLHTTLDGRIAAADHFLKTENWDFFQLHIMGTDRINHFLWGEMEENDPHFAPEFLRYYQRIDAYLGEMADRLPARDCELIILSDHGFCTLRKEVYLNVYLAEKGWLKFTQDQPKVPQDIHPETRAYSLIPGRIYVHLQGREPQGCVAPGREYEEVRERVTQDLLEMRDPETGEAIIRQVLRREDLYAGEYVDAAPDLVAVAYDGYDLKATADKPSLTGRGAITGMHTYEDALLYVRGQDITNEDLSVMDPMVTILKWMGVEPPPDLDGRGLFDAKG